MSVFRSSRDKLVRLGYKGRPLLWVVSYVNQTGASKLFEDAVSDIDASFDGGADGVVLINEWSSKSELYHTLANVRSKFSGERIGVNYLGDDDEPYGFEGSFDMAREFNLSIVWTDFSGVDEINEKPDISLHNIEKHRYEPAFYCSGIHMKYSTLRNPKKTIEQSALQAMGWVDGIVITGAKTGVSADPENVERARRVVSDYPIGLASGVSAQNIHTFGRNVDFCLVASSLQSENKRIVNEKVKQLRAAIDQL